VNVDQKIRVNPTPEERTRLLQWFEVDEVEPGLFRICHQRWAWAPAEDDLALPPLLPVAEICDQIRDYAEIATLRKTAVVSTIGQFLLPRRDVCTLTEWIAINLWLGEEVPPVDEGSEEPAL